jgi:hypothetical protein
MTIIDKIEIKDNIKGTSEIRDVSAKAKNVIFSDNKDLETKYNELYNMFPDIEEDRKGLGTVATKDIPSSGNASADQAVLGSDSRLHHFIIVEEENDPGTGSNLANGDFILVLKPPIKGESYLVNFKVNPEIRELHINLGG